MSDLTMNDVDLGSLNTATKYPSIPTYHRLDPKNGGLVEEPTAFTDVVHISEKLDGTNSRIIQFPNGDYILGSREELLHASGDLIANPALGIVEALRPLAERLTPPSAGIRVLFLEVYGGKVTGASKQYTGTRAVGHRLFDVATIPVGVVLGWPQARISTWREDGGQIFFTRGGELEDFAQDQKIDLVPDLGVIAADALPTSIEETQVFLSDLLPTTQAGLDDSAGGAPEGIILRTTDRSVIAKARFQDYRRTLNRRASGRKNT
ncbi:RNA ligase family protein [Nocardiopsis synnemataformans]|uniref:RNA ligase family protein n=1 Tax=Nocardiopsis synnemataformans TaxID=61305 RepID=UPI003EB920DB